MDWIAESIAVGNFIDARDASKQIVDAMLCLKLDCCSKDHIDLDILCIPLIDGPGNDKRNISEAVEFIHDVVSNGGRVLVHCHAGRSRSVCIVARYFMKKQGLTSHQALQRVAARRDIYLSTGIEELLWSD